MRNIAKMAVFASCRIRIKEPWRFCNIVNKLLLAIILIGLAARIISFFLLPETAYTDALQHLFFMRSVVESGSFSNPELDWALDAPFYYAFVSSMASLIGIELNLFSARIFPMVTTILMYVLSFVLLRRICQKNTTAMLAGLALVSVFPWTVRYGTVNYPDMFSAVLVLAAMCLMSFLKPQNTNAVLFSALAILPSIGLAKLNALFLVPLLILGFALAVAGNRQGSTGLRAKILSAARSRPLWLFAFLVILLCGLWFFRNLVMYGVLYMSSAPIPTDALVEPTLGFLPLSYLSFYDFPPPYSFDSIPLLSGIPYGFALLFILALLPLTAALLYGLYKPIRDFGRNPQVIWLLVPVLFLFSILLAVYINFRFGLRTNFLNMRYLLPVFPLLGVPLAAFFMAAKSPKLKALVIASVLVFSFYSLAYTSLSAVMYNDVYQDHKGLYLAASQLPEGSNVYSRENFRALKFISRNSANMFIPGLEGSNSAEEIAELLHRDNYTHVAISCYKSAWSAEGIKLLEESDLFEIVYKDDCAKIFRLKE